MCVVEADGPIHQIHWNRDHDWRQHPGRQYEEEQITLTCDPEPGESIRGYRPERNRDCRADHCNDQAVQKSVGVL